MIITKQGVRTNSALFIIYLEKIKLLSKPVFKNFISNKVQNDVWIAVFMQLFLVAIDKTFLEIKIITALYSAVI